ncbi:MAG TPA: hypothetical protein G4O01_07885 [Dehalococcoidia bacterium]|jgi:hypothetical protein|nr:hypothetical protein [Dehalococcoidia bacterium]
MRSLSPTLLSAQKQATLTPYVKVEAKNQISGVVRYEWSRLYTGSEDDYFHAVTMPGDGSLIRARITPPADSNKLYRQRVPAPGPSSDFSQWTYTGQRDAAAVACASLGGEVSVFWIDAVNRKIQRIKSTDYGVSWGSPEVIDYSPTTSIGGLAAAYKPNGDLALFFADQATLYVKKYINGQWQAKAAWDKSTGDLSGVACVYDSDWNLLITGKDAAGNFKLWSLIYGDGGDVAVDSWSALKELASAPSGGEFEYHQPFLDKPDVYRCFFIEKFTGSQAYNRPFWSHSVLEARFIDNLWREPVPFNLSSEYGLAMAHYGDYCWLSSPAGVWRAGLTPQSLDLSADILAVREELKETSGRLVVELRNDEGQYTSPGQGNLSPLDIGCQLDFSLGYRTSAGDEVSSGQTFSLEAYEHTSSGGKASLILYAWDGWGEIAAWRARHQFRWNKASSQMSVKDILAFVLARVGLKLEVKSQSSAITSFYPDFIINSGDRGETVVRKLLSFVPDVLFIEGGKAYILNPQASDGSVYSYGVEHQILEASYKQGAWELNRVQVEGYDSGSAQAIVVDSFAWEEIDRLYDRLRQLEDSNIATVAQAQQRGEAYLRGAEIASAGGSILVPVNCGQQLYDVIDITDRRAGLTSEKRRVLGLTLVYEPRRGEYLQRLWLGAV